MCSFCLSTVPDLLICQFSQEFPPVDTSSWTPFQYSSPKTLELTTKPHVSTSQSVCVTSTAVYNCKVASAAMCQINLIFPVLSDLFCSLLSTNTALFVCNLYSMITGAFFSSRNVLLTACIDQVYHSNQFDLDV